MCSLFCLAGVASFSSSPGRSPRTGLPRDAEGFGETLGRKGGTRNSGIPRTGYVILQSREEKNHPGRQDVSHSQSVQSGCSVCPGGPYAIGGWLFLSLLIKCQVPGSKCQGISLELGLLALGTFLTVDLNDLGFGIIGVELRSSALPRESDLCFPFLRWGFVPIPVGTNHDIVGLLFLNSRMCTGRISRSVLWIHFLLIK